jgi:PAT family acetyl-CoA transporter-like MFS transporter 1
LTGPFLLGNVLKLITALCGMVLVWLSSSNTQPTTALKVFLLFLFGLGTLASSLTFVSLCAFFNEISPKSIGGTYLTMLNTVTNLGKAWAGPPVLAAIDYFGFATVNVALLVGGALYLVLSQPYLRSLENGESMTWSSENKV